MCNTLLVLSIEIIIENSRTKPPIIKTVFIELIILLDKTSPRFENDRVEGEEMHSEFLYFRSLDFPHHLNKKPTVSVLKTCIPNKIMPNEKS